MNNEEEKTKRKNEEERGKEMDERKGKGNKGRERTKKNIL